MYTSRGLQRESDGVQFLIFILQVLGGEIFDKFRNFLKLNGHLLFKLSFLFFSAWHFFCQDGQCRNYKSPNGKLNMNQYSKRWGSKSKTWNKLTKNHCLNNFKQLSWSIYINIIWKILTLPAPLGVFIKFK